MKILVADDDLTSRSMLKAVLLKWGYDPIVAVDGNEAWEVMQNTDSLHLAILDWVMPGKTGPEICELLRAKEFAIPPYIILLTSKTSKADIVTGLDLGANDFISKPYDIDELQARIRVGVRMVTLQAALVETKNALAHQSTHDPLTGILNRRAILDNLSTELDRTRRKNLTLSVGLCDIDFFKKVNDTYGHQAGDDVLCSFVEAIQNSVRPYDLIGRYGGEEFLLVVPESTGLKEEGIYERVRSSIADNKISTRAGEISITVSIGVFASTGKETVDEIIAAADEALYKAKDSGRNKIIFAQ
jgi:two-component system, cell cycle response regulator